MNKKLIKQLESVGFAVGDSHNSILVIKQDFTFVYYRISNQFSVFFNGNYIDGMKCEYKNPTFKQILAAIKEHTGVDLQPKKSKTQRIEALEELVKLQNEAIAKLEERNNKIKEALSKIATPEQEQPVFKVGDEVMVVVDDPFFGWGAVDKKTRLIIDNLDSDREEAKVSEVNGKRYDYTFLFRELQHAPKKELKFGGWAEVVGDISGHEFEIGQKVLIGALDSSDGSYFCSTENKIQGLYGRDLKPL